MEASLELQKEIYEKCITTPEHSIKNLVATQLRDNDPRMEIYKAYLGGWKFDSYDEIELVLNTPQLVTKPSDEDVCRKYIQLFESATKRGKEFDLGINDVRKLLNVKKCAYTGVALYRQPKLMDKIPHGKTIDRLDPNKGYVKGNVFAVSHVANQIKNVLFEDKNSIVAIPFGEMAAMMSNVSKLGFSDNMEIK